MTYPEANQFLYDLRMFGAQFGLESTFKLATLGGNPQERLHFIHVAGTNGKGSTCAMLESIYRAAGLRVGLFTSPHLVAFGERIQVNRQLISEADVVRLVGEMKKLLEDPTWRQPQLVAAGFSLRNPPRSDDIPCDLRNLKVAATAEPHHPTFFEVVTVMALRYFAEQKCDLVIWETGLGGRLDATNIVTPLASLITNVQYDHQQWLGDTLPKIASEKAGIIKPGVPIVTGTDEPEALAVIEAAARNNHAPLTVVTRADADRPPLDAIELPLLGEHQRFNATLALATVRAVALQIPVSEEAVSTGLAGVQWAGRLQLVKRPNQTLLLDGAHNVSGVESLLAALRQYFPGRRLALVLGLLQDKDWTRISELLAPVASRIVLAPVSSDRTAPPAELAVACRRINPSVETAVCSSLSEALALVASEPFVVVTGSLYLVGEALELLRLGPTTKTGERGLNEWQATRKKVFTFGATLTF